MLHKINIVLYVSRIADVKRHASPSKLIVTGEHLLQIYLKVAFITTFEPFPSRCIRHVFVVCCYFLGTFCYFLWYWPTFLFAWADDNTQRSEIDSNAVSIVIFALIFLLILTTVFFTPVPPVSVFQRFLRPWFVFIDLIYHFLLGETWLQYRFFALGWCCFELEWLTSRPESCQR